MWASCPVGYEVFQDRVLEDNIQITSSDSCLPAFTHSCSPLLQYTRVDPWDQQNMVEVTAHHFHTRFSCWPPTPLSSWVLQEASCHIVTALKQPMRNPTKQTLRPTNPSDSGSPSQHLQPHERLWARTIQLSCFQISNTRALWDKNICGVKCYVLEYFVTQQQITNTDDKGNDFIFLGVILVVWLCRRLSFFLGVSCQCI